MKKYFQPAPPPRDHADMLGRVGPLSFFDASAFLGDDVVPQSVCDLVLTLALVHNDHRDISWAWELVSSFDKSGLTEAQVSRQNGFHFHLFRLWLSHTHELLNLLAENRTAVEHVFLREVVRRMQGPAREAWLELVAIASDRPTPESPFRRLLLFARNKIGSHYDIEALSSGYRLSHAALREEPSISRGALKSAVRFHFAQTSAIRYLLGRMGVENEDLLGEDRSTAVEQLKLLAEASEAEEDALRDLVLTFIQARGVAWRDTQRTTLG